VIFLDPADSGLMHKLIVTLRKVARGEEATIETVESTSGAEELVFLVGPRAAGFSVDWAERSRRAVEKTSTDR